MCYEVFIGSFETNLKPSLPEMEEFADASRLIYEALKNLGAIERLSQLSMAIPASTEEHYKKQFLTGFTRSIAGRGRRQDSVASEPMQRF